MNYEKLIAGKSKEEIEAIAINWLNRGNRLNNLPYPRNEKYVRVLKGMMFRLYAIGKILLGESPVLNPDYKTGSNDSPIIEVRILPEQPQI